MKKSAAYELGEKAALFGFGGGSIIDPETSGVSSDLDDWMRQTGYQYGGDERSPFIPYDPNKIEARTDAFANTIEQEYLRNMAMSNALNTASQKPTGGYTTSNPNLQAALNHARTVPGVQAALDIKPQVTMRPQGTEVAKTQVAPKPAPAPRNTGIRYRGPGMTAMKNWVNPNDAIHAGKV